MIKTLNILERKRGDFNKMKKHFMYYVSAFVLCMFSCVLLTACGKTDYDMSGVSLQDAT